MRSQRMIASCGHLPVRSRLRNLACSLPLLFLITLSTTPAGENRQTAEPTESAFDVQGLLPKRETGAKRFLEQHPEYDGRGVIVAIFDTGVDLGADGLAKTTDGKIKIIDAIDGTGSGDVPMSDAMKAENGELTGKTGRTLKINSEWKNPSGEYRIGIKPAFDIYPSDLVQRLQSERKEDFEEAQRDREAKLEREIAAEEDDDKKKELTARLAVLRDAIKSFEDPGPFYDCVTFHDGKVWRAVVDTDADGDLADEKAMTDYRTDFEFSKFDDASQLNFSVNIFDEGNLLSIVTVTGNHGTHVAGIVAANYPENPDRNGLAPGAQIVSIKIGDTRLDGMETGPGLIRGLKRTAEMNCDLINMSYGEPSGTPDHGRLVEEFNDIVREKNIVFVGSAGNSGPALSTVGAPGGTSSALIGVGAYVSPEMAVAEYALRKAIPGLPFTWTSRGPTSDGAWGVDLFAPGAAVAPVSHYSLQPSMRMNGTSMASPNACGNIALMISGLKQEKKKYTPTSLLRSLQTTAKVIESADAMSQGAGLVQIEKAYEHHLNQVTNVEEIEFDVSLTTGGRGIYLRDPAEVDRVFEASVDVHPRMENVEDNLRKLDLEVLMKLETKADWVNIGSHFVLTNGGGYFPIAVDPTNLEPGLHVASVRGVLADNPQRGALFELPVVVTIPEPLDENEFEAELSTTGGEPSRTFLVPPTGARTAHVTVERESGAGRSLYFLHTVQLLPGESFEDHESQNVFALEIGETFETDIPIEPGHTLEVCLAQYWSTQGESDVEMSVEFSGLEPSDEIVTLPSDGSAVEFAVSANLGFEVFEPKASLTKWQRNLLPNKSEVILLGSERDGLWDGQQTWQMVLEYEVEFDSNTSIKVTNPALEGLLYDAPVSGQRIHVFDRNKQLVRTGDMYPVSFPVKKGTHHIHVELRHQNRDDLEKLKKLPLVIEQSIGAISVKMYSTRSAALTGTNPVSNVRLQEGQQTRGWLTFPLGANLPGDAKNGDRLTGTLELNDNSANAVELDYYVATADLSSSSSSGAQEPDFKKAELKFWLDRLKTLDWKDDQEQIEQLTTKILKRDPENREVHVARLQLADTDEGRKERLEVVVDLADKVIDAVSQEELKTYFGSRHNEESDDAKEKKKEMEDAKSNLIDSLYRKARALAYMELPDVIEKKPIEDPEAHDKAFEQAFQDLAQWVDTTDEDYFLVHIRRDRRKEKYGQAIQLLNKHSNSGQPEFLHEKKRRDLYELLGWDDLQDYQQRWMWRHFPEERVEF